jgi:hypothetical protein
MQPPHCKKTSFADQENALFYIDKLKRTSVRDKVPIGTYLCPKCFNWHLTSQPSRHEQENKELRAEVETLKQKIKNLRQNSEGVEASLKKTIERLRKTLQSIESENEYLRQARK